MLNFFQCYSREITMLIQLFFFKYVFIGLELLIITSSVKLVKTAGFVKTNLDSEFVKTTVDSFRIVNHFSCIRYPLYSSQGTKTQPLIYSHSNSPLK